VVRQAGLEPVYALMIGGVYNGKAIDRHLFQFAAGKNEIVVEPPVYDKGLHIPWAITPVTQGRMTSHLPTIFLICPIRFSQKSSFRCENSTALSI